MGEEGEEAAWAADLGTSLCEKLSGSGEQSVLTLNICATLLEHTARVPKLSCEFWLWTCVNSGLGSELFSEPCSDLQEVPSLLFTFSIVFLSTCCAWEGFFSRCLYQKCLKAWASKKSCFGWCWALLKKIENKTFQVGLIKMLDWTALSSKAHRLGQTTESPWTPGWAAAKSINK